MICIAVLITYIATIITGPIINLLHPSYIPSCSSEEALDMVARATVTRTKTRTARARIVETVALSGARSTAMRALRASTKS